MNAFTIEEVQNKNSRREGITKEFKTLAQAKRFATLNKVFYGTVLNIYDESGELVAHKENGEWTEVHTLDM